MADSSAVLTYLAVSALLSLWLSMAFSITGAVPRLCVLSLWSTRRTYLPCPNQMRTSSLPCIWPLPWGGGSMWRSWQQEDVQMLISSTSKYPLSFHFFSRREMGGKGTEARKVVTETREMESWGDGKRPFQKGQGQPDPFSPWVSFQPPKLQLLSASHLASPTTDLFLISSPKPR